MMARSRLGLVYERLGKKADAIRQYLAIASQYQHVGDVQKAKQVLDHAVQIAPENVDVRQAVAILSSGRPLPDPTPPLPVSPELPSQPASPTADNDELDPVMEARQKALAQLAEFIFEQLESEQDAQPSRKGLQSIMKGTGLFGSKQLDQTNIMLHLRDAVNFQSLHPDHQQDRQALDELERAVDAGLDHAAVSFDLGYLYFGASRLESALRSLQRSVRHVDYVLGSRLLMGQILLQLGRTKDAAVELLEALKLADMRVVAEDQSAALGHLYDPIIENYSRTPESEATRQLCENIVGLLNKTGWRGQLARARQQFLGQTNGEALMPLADMLIQAHTSQLVDSMARIQQLNQAGKPRAAMEEVYYALQYAPTYLPLHIQMGEMLLQQSQITAAVEKFKMIARCFYVRGDSGRAIGLLQRIVGISAMDVDARNQLIELLTSHGNMEEVVNEYMHLADVYYNLADLANTRETLQQALHVSQQMNLSRDTRIKVLQRMADIDLQSLEWKQALKTYEQIRNIRPEDAQVRKTMIDLYFRLGQVNQALAEMNNFVSTSSERKQTESTLQFLGLMESEHPDQPAIMRLEADVFRKAGRTAEAITKLDAAGELYLQKGNPAAAKETIMAILSLNPQNAAEYQQLLALLASKGVK